VATDGRRLAVVNGAAACLNGHDTKGTTPVVPTKAMNLLERNLQDPNEVVRITIRPNQVLFKTERAVISSLLVEGRYPAYREVFPKKQTVKIPLTAGPFHAAVRQSAIMTDEESKRVKFSFTKKNLTLQAQGVETGRSKVEIPLDYDGKPIDINFDPKFLTDMLRVLEPDAALTLELVDGNSPALFRCGDNYSYIVMPLT
jgi:DNA polymerase-3 subunit beta